MIRTLIYSTVIAFCLVASVALNIMPRLTNLTFVNVIMVVVQGSFILAAAVIPTAMKYNNPTLPQLCAGWSTWAFFVLASFTFGMEGSSHFRADATREARLEIQDRGITELQLAQLRQRRAALGDFKSTSESAVEIAKHAWGAAVDGKKTECGTGVGTFCKKWDDTIAAKLTSWSLVEAAWGATKKAQQLDTEINTLELALKGKVAPDTADPMASGWANLLALIGLKVGEDRVAPWITIALSLLLEMMGGLVPWIVLPGRQGMIPNPSSPHPHRHST